MDLRMSELQVSLDFPDAGAGIALARLHISPHCRRKLM